MKTTHPSKPLSDPSFKYVPACETNLAETFRLARERIAREKAGKVVSIKSNKEQGK